MLERLISIVVLIIEAVVTLFSGFFEFIIGFFVGATETITIVELCTLLVVMAVEVLLWVLLLIAELFFSLITWRKPKFIKKPILWRPVPKKNHKK